MTKNMGTTDKLIRLSVALVIAILFYIDIITGTTAILLGVLGVIFALTSLINFCPLYSIFGINTCKVK